MASLNGQTIASSYEQLLHVDADGGGNGTTHVSVKDGDNGTTFGFTIATDALMMTSTNRLEFGDNASYIHQSADGVLDLVSDTEIEINATTVDINGAVDISGLTTVAANITVSGSDPTSINAGEIAGDNDVLGINIKNTNTGDGTGGMLKFMSDNGDAITAIAHNQSANTSGEMLFFTENSGTFAERMKIDSSGKVGVGVSPAKLFHVEGSVGGDFLSRIKNTDGTNGEGLQIHADNTNSASRALDVRNSNGQIFQVYNDGNIVIKGDGSDQTTKWHSGSAYVNAKLDVRQLAIAFSGSDKVTSDTSGNFTFANTLTVGSIADEGDAIITNGADAGRYDVLTVKEDGNTRWELSFEGNGSTNSLTFGSNISEQNIANGGVLTLLPDGNVGIGCSPDSKLKIQENTNGENVAFAMRAFNQSGSGKAVTFTLDPDAESLTLTNLASFKIDQASTGQFGNTALQTVDGDDNGGVNIEHGAGDGRIRVASAGSFRTEYLANQLKANANGFDIRTTDAQNVTISTNDSIRMSVAGSSGNVQVGAGTDYPGFTPSFVVQGSNPSLGLRKQDSNSGSFFNTIIASDGNSIRAFYSHQYIMATASNDGGTNESTKLTLDTSGNLTIAGSYSPSDINLKTNIEELPNILNVLSGIKPIKYKYKRDIKEGMDTVKIGLIAQEVEKHFPELILENSIHDTEEQKFKSLNYNGMIPVLLKAIQELSAKVEKLEKKCEDCC